MTTSQALGFLAAPNSGTGPGVLVLHAWWGLNDTIKAVCKRLAESGFVAFAPDLYHGKVADTIADAEILGRCARRQPPPSRRPRSRMPLSSSSERAGQAGPRPGGDRLLAGRLLRAGPRRRRSRAHPFRRPLLRDRRTATSATSRAAYLGHFAENDEFEPQSNVDALEESLRRAGRPVTFYRYGGTGHWFFEPDRSQAYNAAAAQLAWDRTLAFLAHSGA